MKILIAIAALLAAPCAASADAFKCKDANGRTVYQSSPCEVAGMSAAGKVKAPAAGDADYAAKVTSETASRQSKIDESLSKRAAAQADADKKATEARHLEAAERAAEAEERKTAAAEGNLELNRARNYPGYIRR